MSMSIRLEELKNVELRLGRIIEKLMSIDRRFSFCRLSAFLTGIAGGLVLYVLRYGYASAAVLILSFGALFFLSHRHSKILSKLKFYRIALYVKQSNIARLSLDWKNIKSYSGADYKADFRETDLNLVGEESLHLLMDTATSKEGSGILRQWLKEPELSIPLIYKRQDLVKELIPMVKFRENLIVSALFSGKPSDGSAILSWLEKERDGKERKLRRAAVVLSVLAPVNIILILLNIWNIIPTYWVISTAIYLSVYYMNQKNMEDIPDETDILKKELGSLSRIFRNIETNRFSKSPGLKELCRPFHSLEAGPSSFMKKIKRIIYTMQLRGNPLIWFLIILVTPLDYLCAIELGKLKKEISRLLPEWLRVWHSLEALSSLANFAYLNPGYAFPEVNDGKSGKSFITVENLGHPLIPEGQKVRNDFVLDQENKINLITGSNMSGKSTFLRTLGINSALALAGAPVDASKMELRLSRLFTCIKVTDSVTDGISYFYAEVKRLKTLLLMLDDGEELPVFFLIDEIFKGTNNVERLVGSRSFIKALEGKNGFGAITTHDLELTKIAGEISSARNYHFREKVSENVMTFDYQLREGPCPTTNALKIMRLEGLPIDEEF
ncbi:MAG: MutS-related protein [Bacteroidota bacterium]